MSEMKAQRQDPESLRFRYLATPDEARRAREDLAGQLMRWGCQRRVDDAMQVGAELFANAIQHGTRSPEDMFVVRLAKQCNAIEIGVWDPSPEMPKKREPDYAATSGRGLYLVEVFSNEWGSRRELTGKCVWARLNLP